MLLLTLDATFCFRLYAPTADTHPTHRGNAIGPDSANPKGPPMTNDTKRSALDAVGITATIGLIFAAMWMAMFL